MESKGSGDESLLFSAVELSPKFTGALRSFSAVLEMCQRSPGRDLEGQEMEFNSGGPWQFFYKLLELVESVQCMLE